ncbi:hypothetical protein D3C79_718140 [compost metagenome]
MHVSRVEYPGGRRAGKVRGDELGFGAVLVADDLQGAAGDQVTQAGDQAAVGDKTDAHRAQVRQGQALTQGNHQLVIGVVALGDQHRGAVTDDFTDGRRLLQGIGRVGGAGVGQAADPGKLDALGDRDDQHAVAAVVVEGATVEWAILACALASWIGTCAAVAIEAGPAHLGKVVELRHRGASGIDHARHTDDHAAAFGDVDIATVDQGAAARVKAEAASDVGADAIDGVDHADQGQLVQFGWQLAAEGDVVGIVVATG